LGVVRDLFEDGFGVCFKTGALPEENTKKTKMAVKTWQKPKQYIYKKVCIIWFICKKRLILMCAQSANATTNL